MIIIKEELLKIFQIKIGLMVIVNFLDQILCGQMKDIQIYLNKKLMKLKLEFNKEKI